MEIKIKNKKGAILKTAGTYVEENISVSVDSTNLIPENIKSGVSILGVEGTHEGGSENVDDGGDIATLYVKRVDTTSYVGSTSYSTDSIIILQIIHDESGEEVTIKYNDEIMNYDQSGTFIIGKYKGVDDGTPVEGILEISGGYCGYGAASHTTGKSASKTLQSIQKILLEGKLYDIPPYGFINYDFEGICNFKKIRTIGSYAFHGGTILDPGVKNLDELILPSTLIEIGEYAFSRNTNLQSIKFSNGLQKIGKYAFYYCTKLTKLNLPASLLEIGDYAFSWCTALTSIKLPDSLTTIPIYAFEQAESLINLDLGNGLTTLKSNAFTSCKNLATITIPATLINLSPTAFVRCEKLNSFIVDTANPVYDSRDNCNAIIETATNTVLYASTNFFTQEFSIPNIIIAPSVFYLGNITQFTIPSYITSIDAELFSMADYLTDLIVPDTVTYIAEKAFANCNSLRTLTIPFVGDSFRTSDEYPKYPFTYLFGTSSNLSSVKWDNQTTETLDTDGTIKTSSSSRYVPTTLNTVIITAASIPNTAFKNARLANLRLPNLNTSFSVSNDYSSSSTNPPIITNVELPIGILPIKGLKFTNLYIKGTLDNWLDTWCTQTIEEQDSYNFPSTDTLMLYTGQADRFLYFETTEASDNSVEYFSTFYEPTSNLTINTPIINPYVFCGYKNLNSLTLGPNVTKIDPKAFMECTNLTSISVDSANTVYDSRDNCNMIIEKATNKLILAATTANEVPASVKTIDRYAFISNTTPIYLPEGITCLDGFDTEKILVSIANGVSGDITYNQDSSHINALTVPNSLKVIGEGYFLSGYLKHLNNASFSNLPILKRIEEKAFSDIGAKSLRLPLAAEYGSSICANTSYLTEVYLPEGMTEIPSMMFSKSAVSKLTLPSTLKSIGSWAFYNANFYNKTLDFPEGLEYIGENVFQSCSGPKNVKLPNSIKYLGDDAFDSYTGIGFNHHSDNTYLGNDSNPYLVLVEVYNSKTAFTLLPETKVIAGGAFYNCKSLNTINLHEDIHNTHISKYTFWNCESLSAISIPESVHTIEYGAFNSCKALIDLTIPNNVTVIDRSAIIYCDNLQNLILSDNLISWGYDNLTNCPNINFTTYDNGLYLGSSTNPYLVLAKVISKDISSCEIHPNTKIIGDAFADCTNLTSIVIPTGVRTIAQKAFSNCTSLVSVELPDSIQSIEKSAFEGCTQLTNISLLENLTTIGENAFKGCSSLTSITLPTTVKTVGAGAFRSCPNINEITIKSASICLKPRILASDNIENTAPVSIKLEITNSNEVADIYTTTWAMRELKDITVANATQLDLYKADSCWGKYASYMKVAE